MGRSPCCAKEGMNRGTWSATEDQILKNYINIHGEGKWRRIPKEAGLKRCGKSCRLRWLNYLRPDIKRGNITLEEEDLIIRLHKLLGNRWSLIAGRIPGRTDNEIKNYWNTTLGKKVTNINGEYLYKKCPPSNEKQKSKTKLLSGAVDESISAAVRTKAVRCNRVVDTSHLVENADATDMYTTNNFSEDDSTVTISTTISEDLAQLDFDVRKIFNMSENVPQSLDDFWEICHQFGGGSNGVGVKDQYGGNIYTAGGSGGGSNNYKWLSAGSEPILFSEEMLKDWMRDDEYCFRHQS